MYGSAHAGTSSTQGVLTYLLALKGCNAGNGSVHWEWSLYFLEAVSRANTDDHWKVEMVPYMKLELFCPEADAGESYLCGQDQMTMAQKRGAFGKNKDKDRRLAPAQEKINDGKRGQGKARRGMRVQK
eukprot:1145298-Pelagomonas_calceolata.AAC.1